jgi:hypothetical protein
MKINVVIKKKSTTNLKMFNIKFTVHKEFSSVLYRIQLLRRR